MTVLISVRSVIELPTYGISSGAQPVMGFNYGAKAYRRVKQAIHFTVLCGGGYNIIAWIILLLFPRPLMSIFTSDPELLSVGPQALRLYFLGFFFMCFQFAGQIVFQALGFARYASFFALLRKAIIIIPLTVLLPRTGLGVMGVFLAEPISNFVGGLSTFTTMYVKIYRKLDEKT